MPEPTLPQVFGDNATQTSDQIAISKDDLENVGLTVDSENSAESLLTAILLRAANYLTPDNQENVDSDIQLTVEREEDSILTRNDIRYRQHTFIVNLQKPEPIQPINPDEF